ncbi:L-ornithine N(5)-monooxygenase [Actinoplanes sp. NBRC 14428]|uniref:L-lysine N6-monooxygenase MbtG n=1 Tax=Pseudosporangium ferrugineum TaxID=439699 RepID=A0A2T0RRW6_9ACTN|nr:SidA/IucD/PvdA family monooxygenase [Pseudosporangium ferrugineum]PRY23882.1 L-ornithine N5-oxygenase [Pseudosporangium ferrugineum]BCJ51444.1 L-ornithine N(5)-monooxygenase [Actinoplanes sp. NBRC 14428]
MTVHDVDIAMIGAGPSNLALAVALEECGSPELAAGARILERHDDVKWQRNLLLPWTRSQVSYVKDLVTLRNPRSRFSFLNFLHERGELDEFVNLGTFNPFRWQLSTYQQWVADNLEHVRMRYGADAEQILPVHSEEGAIVGFAVSLSDGDTVICRDLVFGGGRDAFVPEVFRGLPDERVVHSTRYGSRVGAARELARPGQPLRPVVVGGAQSAAEMFMALHEDAPGSSPTMLLRSIGLKDYQTSKFVNELFFPSFVDDFYAMPPKARARVLDEMHLTNYAGLAPPFLDELYTMIYRQRMLGRPVSAVRPLTEVVAARVEALPGGGEEVVLEVRDLRCDAVEEVRCDAVFLGTGFDPRMPAIVRRLAEAVALPEITVNRDYRVDLGAGATGGLYLQGVNEATHGISDSLISVLAQRSADIARDMMARRDADRGAGRLASGQAVVMPV